MANQHTDSIAKGPAQAEIEMLLPKVVAHAPGEAVEMLAPYPNEFVAKMLTLLNPALAQDVLERFPSERRQKIVAAAPPETRQQWVRDEAFPESTIRRCHEGHHVASLSGLSGVRAARQIDRIDPWTNVVRSRSRRAQFAGWHDGWFGKRRTLEYTMAA